MDPVVRDHAIALADTVSGSAAVEALPGGEAVAASWQTRTVTLIHIRQGVATVDAAGCCETPAARSAVVGLAQRVAVAAEGHAARDLLRHGRQLPKWQRRQFSDALEVSGLGRRATLLHL